MWWSKELYQYPAFNNYSRKTRWYSPRRSRGEYSPIYNTEPHEANNYFSIFIQVFCVFFTEFILISHISLSVTSESNRTISCPLLHLLFGVRRIFGTQKSEQSCARFRFDSISVHCVPKIRNIPNCRGSSLLVV